ncbi:MAG: large conductance mechanosensitive channel protein MscL [Actinobacteria bacterium]|nr:large conductance mechanosensitive channel protein MscL [Actinomycetota bacterium]
MRKEFKEFIFKGNVIDLAVGIIIGVAFSAIINSLVNDIIMPPIGLLLGRVDFANLFAVLKGGATPPPYLSLEAAKEAGAVTLNYGLFINTIISFLIIAIVIFFIIKALNSLKKKEEKAVKESLKTCPFCFTEIDIRATRCPNCTAELK